MSVTEEWDLCSGDQVLMSIKEREAGRESESGQGAGRVDHCRITEADTMRRVDKRTNRVIFNGEEWEMVVAEVHRGEG